MASQRISSTMMKRMFGRTRGGGDADAMPPDRPPSNRSRREIVGALIQDSLSKVKSQHELHDARISGRRKLAEGRIDLLPGRIESRRGIDAGELGVVEHIVSFGAELQPCLLVDGELLVYREVPVIHSRAA